MKRGTLMVLKRLLVTALSALGLGALAAGTAVAQNTLDDVGTQIPAPRLYGDITSCAGGTLPTPSTARQASQRYKALLDRAFDSDTGTDGIQMDFTQNAARIGTNTDGALASERTDILALLDVAACTDPVASNVARAGTLYGNYISARNAYNRLEEPDADDAATRDAARMKKEDFGGDVYDAVYDQRARLSAATRAITDYNNLVGAYVAATETVSAMGVLAGLKVGDGTNTGYDAINIRASTTRVTDFDANPTPGEGETVNGLVNAQVAPVYGSGNTAGYRSIAGHDAADSATEITETLLRNVDAPGSRAAFDAAGTLQLHESNTGTNAFTRSSANIVTLGNIANELSRWQTAVNTFQTAYDDAVEAGNLDTRTVEENLRRAKLGRDHVQSELDRLTRVVRSQNLPIAEGSRLSIGFGDNAVMYESERVLVDAYLRARGDVLTKATAVRTAIANLDNANKALQGKLSDADAYLNQLVTLRRYELAERQAEQEEAGGDDALQSFKDAVTDANSALTRALNNQMTHRELTGNADSTAKNLLDALLEPKMKAGERNAADDDGSALLTAISAVDSKIDTLEGQLTDADGNPIDLSNLGNAEEITALSTDVSTNTTDIEGLDGRVTANEGDIDQIEGDIDQINMDLYGTTSSQHADASACAEGAGGLVNIANCADARSRHNEEDIADLGGDIEALDGRVGDNEDDIAANTKAIESNDMDIAANTAAIESNDMDIAANTMAIESNDMDIAANTMAIESNDIDIAANTMAIESNDMDIAMNAEGIMTNAGNIMANAEAIVAEASERMGADMMLAGAIEEAVAAGAAADMALSGRIGSNADAIAANMNSIGQNASAISDNRNMIGELSDDLDVVRAGVAASMALAGMPAVNGRGIAIGVGSFDGESAFAVGFQIQGEQASFKVGVTSSGGATGASAGVGFNF